MIVAVLTTNVAAATAASDYLLQDWQFAGLHSASAFRTYLGMAPKSAVRHVGHLSQRDWDGVLKCLGVAIADS